MFRLLLAVLCAAVLLVSPAWATEVRLRVEGAHQTIFEGVVDTAPRVLDGGDGTGPIPVAATTRTTRGPRRRRR